MEENSVNEDITVTYKYESPTIGEQLTAAAIGIGVSLGAYALIVGGAVVYSKVSEKIQTSRERKKMKRELKNATEETEN